jgi:hypothetical protein
MNTLDSTGLKLALKNKWLKINGTYEVQDAIYILLLESIPAKAKKPIIVKLDVDVNLSDRFTAFVEYHPQLRTKGTLNGPTTLHGSHQELIEFRFMADEDMDLGELPWIAKLIVAKIQA